MSHAEYLVLSRSLAAEAAAKPDVFLRRLRCVVALAIGAVVFLAALPVLSVGSLAASESIVTTASNGTGALMMAVLMVMGVMLWARLATLIRVPPRTPPGLELGRGEAPGLFAALDDLCRATGAAPFDAVLLSHDCNAQVVQGPRPGVKGRRRYLVVGVPLLLGLPAEEMRAVLAHEIAHRADRSLLTRLTERVESWLSVLGMPLHGSVRRAARGILDAPLTWFGPRFRAHVRIYSRMREFEADALAAKVVGKEPMAGALARLAVLHGCFDSWLTVLGREAASSRHAPDDLPERWSRTIAAPNPQDSARWLDRARRETVPADSTHPSLSDRWSALGVAAIAAPPPPPATSAWAEWLGEAREGVTRKFATWWTAALAHPWHERRETLKEAEAIRLENTPGVAGGGAQRAWEHAAATMEFEGIDAARPLVEDVLALDPLHESARHWRICDLLEADDPKGVGLLRDFPDGNAKEDLWLRASAYFARTSRPDEELKACENADAAAVSALRVARECGPLAPGDIIGPHTLSPGHVALLAERAAVNPLVSRLAVVRKELPSRPRDTFHLVVLETAASRAQGNHCVQEFQSVMNHARVPGLWLVRAVGRRTAEPSRVVFKAPGATLYDQRHAAR